VFWRPHGESVFYPGGLLPGHTTDPAELTQCAKARRVGQQTPLCQAESDCTQPKTGNFLASQGDIGAKGTQAGKVGLATQQIDQRENEE